MFEKKIAYVLAHFGEPRNICEIRPFLESLLTNSDLIQTRYPKIYNQWLCKRLARKRAKKMRKNYIKIGGKSPIFFDTESIAHTLERKIDAPVLTFHRFLPDTYKDFIQQIHEIDADEIRIFPLFAQFSYAMSGNIARFFSEHFHESILRKIRWIKSYPGNSFFLHAMQKKIIDIMEESSLLADETIFFFFAQGIPKQHIEKGDIYETECQISFTEIMKNFPYVLGKLGYQSNLSPKGCLKPHIMDLCHKIDEWSQGRKNLLLIPLSTTCDNIETVFEITYECTPLLKAQGYRVFQCPSLNQDNTWIDAIASIIEETNLLANQMLIRAPLKNKKYAKKKLQYLS